MKRTGSVRGGGFTLIELIVAVTITVLITGAASMILINVTAAQQRVERQLRLQQRARVAVTSIAHALHNAYRPPRASPNEPRRGRMLVGEDGWRGDLPRDRVRVRTISRRPVRHDQPESDVRVMEFFILDPATADRLTLARSGDPPSLLRRTDPTHNPPPDEGGVVVRLVSHVVGLNLEYFDGAQWRDRWDTRRHGWPTAVRVRVIVAAAQNDLPAGADGGNRKRTWSVARLVSFPRLSRSGGGQTGGLEELRR